MSVTALKQRANTTPAVFPDTLVAHYLDTAGCAVAESEVTRLVSMELLAFVEDVVAECKSAQAARRQQQQQQPSSFSSSTPAAKRVKISASAAATTDEISRLEAQDVEDALKLHKFQVSRAPYHAL